MDRVDACRVEGGGAWRINRENGTETRGGSRGRRGRRKDEIYVSSRKEEIETEKQAEREREIERER